MSLMRSRLFALAAALFAGAAHAQSCPEPAVWTLPGGERPRVAAATALLDDMAQRDVVLLGEVHDEMDHHRWQLQTLAALHARRPDMVIGFEMFPRRVQPVLDRWYGHLREVEPGVRAFGVHRYRASPTAQPPTLTATPELLNNST